MVAPITTAVKLRVYVDFDSVSAGTGTTLIGGLNANDPGFGQSLYPGASGAAQTKRRQVAEQVLGAGGSITLAEIAAAITAAGAALAGSSGTPLITAADLAEINGWATGNP